MKLKKLQANELPSLMQAFIKEKIQYVKNGINWGICIFIFGVQMIRRGEL